MYVDILNGLIFDTVYGSWIRSLPLFTLDIRTSTCLYCLHVHCVYQGL